MELTIDIYGTPVWVCRCTAQDDLQKMVDHLTDGHPNATITLRKSSLNEAAMIATTQTMIWLLGGQRDLFAILA